ncbi:MAG: orotate phosphoribosyltransferase [Candidatus Omnitrophica bacterium CG07_land_8_20_14_0_80_42_15]|uniref:Orotate phosphoribosyltransferase n=1 Tax=Candidatus Aquitaenariimonas noxiae TaxID=1974741 RepID=A0A2J0KVJ5_9BACT|nr:MAG: orotate phosphoribosyltransferase [Candidatus Omnitrophica bacterium CG07_land_8_20_14_0_80_42_15]
MPKKSDVAGMFKKTGAMLEGHFELSSGLHSDKYLQCAKVLQYPKYSEKLCRELAGYFKKEKPTVVIAPAIGGVVVSYETARWLGARSLFTERKDEKMVLRRGFELNPGDKVLAVEDVITTSGSVREVIEVVKENKAKLVGVGCIIDRSGKRMDFGVKFKSLLKLDVPTFAKEACPLCKKGLRITKPGSKKLVKQ